MIETVLIAVALAMDCFAVSVVAGVIVRTRKWGLILHMALLFGLYQALMPLLGWLLTSRFSTYLQAVDHWMAFGMLALIGGKMIWDALSQTEEPSFDPSKQAARHLLALATSIDALAIGITFACTGYDHARQLIVPLVIIGAVSFLFSIAGFLLGERFGEAVNRRVRPELVGGLILIAIGVRILIEHLG